MNTNKSKLVLKMVMAILVLIFISSCNSNVPKENISMESVEVLSAFETIESKEEGLDSKQNENQALKDLKIIKSASVKFKVKEVESASKEIQNMVFAYKGYISDQRFQNDLYQIENRFTIKVPQNHFVVLLDSLTSVAEFVDYVNITSEDVTEEYVDIQSRLATKLEVKQRYEEILRKHAKTVEDVLVAEEKLSVIQEEIEASEGRLKYLTNKVSFSTIQVDLYQEVSYIKEPTSYSRTFVSKVSEGFSFGFKLIEKVILALIYIWPFILIGSIVFFVLKRKSK